MKTCSKCKRELEEGCFTKLKRAKDGLYPSCRECEKSARINFLETHPMCATCGKKPHINGNYYCYECDRKRKGKGPPKWSSRRTGLEWCKVCEQRPRLPYHQYCHLCKMEYQNRNRAKKWRERYSNDEDRRREVVRHYATNLLKRGKIKRGPCVFCGRPGEHFHHFDYDRKTMNFVDVCIPCHVGIHQILEAVLTLSRYGAIDLSAA